MSDGVFGKTMGNLRKHRIIKLEQQKGEKII